MNKIPGNKRKSVYFWTFPIRGLKISNKLVRFPLKMQFGDAGIYSIEQCRKIVESVEWKGNFDANSIWEMSVRKGRLDHRVDSLILVRRTISKDDEIIEKEKQSAETRAREISSLLMVLLAHISNLKMYCGFPSELRHLGDDYFGFSIVERDFHLQRSWSDKISSTDPIEFSNASLERKLLRYKWMKGLTRIVIDTDPHFLGEVADSVKRALGRISEGLYSHTAEDYVLASQTAIEILLSNDQGKEAELKGRIKGLLLDNEEFDSKIEQLFTLRNNWVHRGKQITDEQAKECLDIGIAVLLAYAKLAARLPAKTPKEQIIMAIDFAKYRLKKTELPILISEMKRAAAIREKYS